MLLKRLEFQGFKTFAHRTEFEFGSGVTAIVGPNGSGKSNIADAVRWVLGEQSGRLLRTKKSEDVIFAGSSLRSPAGMAEVALTFDNCSGDLPLDFSEVTISRRLYRTGESEYYVNRGKVRLKDVVEILSKAGAGQNDYAVVGQGLVDSALSLRPEDRRSLIEEAADTRRYYAKINEAQAKLEATLQNLDRARDLLAEIGPRLGRLQKQASQASEYDRITRELSTLLAAWYYQSWQKTVESLLTSRGECARLEHDLKRRQEEFSALVERIEEVREARNHLRAEVESWNRELSTLNGRMDRLSRQLAVDRERLASIAQQRRNLADEVDSVTTNVSTESEALAEATTRLAALQSDSERERAQLTVIQAELDDLSSRQAQLQGQLSKVQEQSFASAAASSDAKSRLAQLVERDTKLASEVHRLGAEDGRLNGAIASQLALVEQFRTRLEACERDSSELRAERERSVAAMSQVRELKRNLENDLAEAHRERTRLQSQYDALSKLQDSYTGLYAGVRTVLQAAKNKDVRGIDPVSGVRNIGPTTSRSDRKPDAQYGGLSLAGVIGIVASLIDVPQSLEVAIEVALGSHLQDIVVERWTDAEKAIELLKATKGGRATFLPLDALRAGRLASAPNVAGVIGVASELVVLQRHDDRLTMVVRQLLGQTIVVKDLSVARGLLGRGDRTTTPTYGQIVTTAGEIARPGGSVTGGATRSQAEGAMLSRERELRELPEEIRRAIERQSSLEKKLETANGQERRLGVELNELDKKERQLNLTQRAIEGELSKCQRQLDRSRQEADWQKGLDRQIETERAEIEAKRQELAAKLLEAERAGEASRQGLADLQRNAEGLLKARAGVQERLNELKTRLAVMNRAMESERALMANHEQTLRRLEAQREARRERMETLAEDGRQLETEVDFLDKERGDLERQIEALDVCTGPSTDRLTELDTEESALLAGESNLRSEVLNAERKLVQANHVLQRGTEELSDLRERMESEGIELPIGAGAVLEHPDLASQPWQLSLALREENQPTAGHSAGSVALLEENDGDGMREGRTSGEITAHIATDPAALKRRVDRLRSQLRNLGPVNPSAVDEYEEAKERYEFLRTQTQDLAESEGSLREAIVLLKAQAQKQYDAAFETIEKEFRRFFTQLFGGGMAKLVRFYDEDGGERGLDIIAQPPGKRLQSLSSLSGGERALTAIALLFAILKANPAPFCVLDEVDAALDEANVNRFATALKGLCERTQFIVITHNRGTVELADTLYGISLGPDSISRVVSLRIG